jgi:hypothetical protein
LISYPDLTGADDLSVDTHDIVAVMAHQLCDHRDVAYGSLGVDLRCSTTGDWCNDAQSGGTDRQDVLGLDPFLFLPCGQSLEIDVGTEADRIDRSAELSLNVMEAREVDQREYWPVDAFGFGRASAKA